MDGSMQHHRAKLWAFMLLALGINVIGVMSFFFYERQQRAAFLETRQSLETKLTLEQESQEQVSEWGSLQWGRRCRCRGGFNCR